MLIPTPVPLSTPVPTATDFSIPGYVWILLAAVIIVQGIAFVRRRRK